MGRGFDFRNHLHTFRLRIFQQFNHLLASVVAVGTLAKVVGIAIAVEDGGNEFVFVKGAATARRHFGQLWQSGDFHTPSLIVAEVEVKHIQLIVSQQINHSLHILESGEISRHIEHETTITEVGAILHHGIFQAVCLAVVEGGNQGFHTIHAALFRASGNQHLAICYHHFVSLARQFFISRQRDSGGSVACGIHATLFQFIEHKAAGIAKLTALHSHHIANGSVSASQRHAFWCWENVVAVGRCLRILQRLVKGIHSVAVGIVVGATLELFGIVERSDGNFHANRLFGVAIHHHMPTHRHITDIHHRATHQHIHHHRIARSERVVAVVGRNLIVGGAHLLNVNRQLVAQFQATRKLVEIELPILFKW